MKFDMLDLVRFLPGADVNLSTKSILLHRSMLPVLDAAGYYAEVDDILAEYEMAEDVRPAIEAKLATLPNLTLRPHQLTAIEHILTRRGSLIGDSPRLGKTIPPIVAHDPATGPLVVIAPLSTREVWRRWFAAIWPDLEVGYMLGHHPEDRKLKAPIIFGHYDILAHWQDASLRPGTLVFDEAHLLSNRRAQRSLAAVGLSSRAFRTVGLTGTPLWNRPVDFWTVLGIIVPGAWGSVREFGHRYGDPMETGYGVKYQGASNMLEFRQRLGEVMLRRTWDEVMPDLPPIQRVIEVIDLDHKGMAELDGLAAEIRSHDSAESALGDMTRYRQASGKFKAQYAIAAAKAIMARGEPVVVWTWHRKLAAKIAKALGTVEVSGVTPVRARDQMFDDWRTTAAGALVVTFAVGQVGLDFSHAKEAVMAEIDYTPAIVSQAEMRTFDPARPMTITYLMLDHPADRALVATISRKCELGQQLELPASDTAIGDLAKAFGFEHAVVADLAKLQRALFQAGVEDEIFLTGRDRVEKLLK